MKDTVLVDLDGTLANIDHRLHFIKRKKPRPDFKSFNLACVNDTPNQWCVDLITSLVNNCLNVLIVTARSKTVEVETRAWLKRVFPFPGADDMLTMLRESNDYTEDSLLKKDWLTAKEAEEPGFKKRILFVVDDRQRVVDMWRQEGLVCLQCYVWPEWKSAVIQKSAQ